VIDDYVTNDAWLANPSRDETIDEVADQFERSRSDWRGEERQLCRPP
jgi:hypothetical protein